MLDSSISMKKSPCAIEGIIQIGGRVGRKIAIFFRWENDEPVEIWVGQPKMYKQKTEIWNMF